MNRAGGRRSRAQKGSPKSKAPVEGVRARRLRLAGAETCLPPACAARAGKCRHRQAATLRPNGGSWAVGRSKRNRGLSTNRPLFAVPPSGDQSAPNRLKPELQTCGRPGSWAMSRSKWNRGLPLNRVGSARCADRTPQRGVPTQYCGPCWAPQEWDGSMPSLPKTAPMNLRLSWRRGNPARCGFPKAACVCRSSGCGSKTPRT